MFIKVRYQDFVLAKNLDTFIIRFAMEFYWLKDVMEQNSTESFVSFL